MRQPTYGATQDKFTFAFNVTRASHVYLTTPDLGASRTFYTEVIGLTVSDEDADTVFLRGVEEVCHHSVVLRRSAETPICAAVGFRVFEDADLDALFDSGIRADFGHGTPKPKIETSGIPTAKLLHPEDEVKRLREESFCDEGALVTFAWRGNTVLSPARISARACLPTA